MTGKVVLEGLEFHAYHGVYAHERSSGNKFEVDIEVETEIQPAAFDDDLTGTLNYEDLYALVKDEMERPAKLLERVGYAMADRVLQTFPRALHVRVKIAKFNPPIGGVCRQASVMVSKGR